MDFGGHILAYQDDPLASENFNLLGSINNLLRILIHLSVCNGEIK